MLDATHEGSYYHDMNRLTTEQRAQILGLMVEGMAIRAISRQTGASKNTIVKLLVDVGRFCAEYQDHVMRDLPCKRLQLDEIWSFVGAKEKNVPYQRKGFGRGDVWTWTAIDADTKLIPSWIIGDRTGHSARLFVDDLAKRLKGRVQITSDGHRPYINAIDEAFGGKVDYAMLEKIYASPVEAEKRYSPPVCVGAKRREITGNPDHKHISTSYAERSNLSIRMGLRRFTRLTNAFSKKVENHFYALAIYFMHYNFCRIHQTLRVTPAMGAGVTNKLYELVDVIEMADDWEPRHHDQRGRTRK